MQYEDYDIEKSFEDLFNILVIRFDQFNILDPLFGNLKNAKKNEYSCNQADDDKYMNATGRDKRHGSQRSPGETGAADVKVVILQQQAHYILL